MQYRLNTSKNGVFTHVDFLVKKEKRNCTKFMIVMYVSVKTSTCICKDFIIL